MPRCSDSPVVRLIDRIILRPCIPLGLDIFQSVTRIPPQDGQCWDGPFFMNAYTYIRG